MASKRTVNDISGRSWTVACGRWATPRLRSVGWPSIFNEVFSVEDALDPFGCLFAIAGGVLLLAAGVVIIIFLPFVLFVVELVGAALFVAWMAGRGWWRVTAEGEELRYEWFVQGRRRSDRLVLEVIAALRENTSLPEGWGVKRLKD